jgi:hypothetical protein
MVGGGCWVTAALTYPLGVNDNGRRVCCGCDVPAEGESNLFIATFWTSGARWMY